MNAAQVRTVVRKPNPGPQLEFLRSSADIVIYGGAAGGGKTYAIGLEGLRHAPTVPGFVAVYLRREQVDIKQKGGLLDAVKALWVPRGAKLNHTTLTFTWPNGGAIQLGSAQREDDVHKFDGAEICALIFDEVQHFEESQFWYLLSRNRSSCGVTPYVRGTCNPSADSWLAGFLAWWIDEEGFAVPERSGAVRWMVRRGDVVHWADTPDELHAQFPTTDEQRAKGEQGCYPKSVSFIAAKLSDNPMVNKEYIANLDNLPRVERARLLGGNWKVRPSAGDYFPRTAAPIVDVADQGAIIKKIRHWDLAASEPSEVNPDPDFTAGVLLGLYRDRRWVVLDVIAGRWRAHKVEELIRRTAESDGRGVMVSIPQDPGQAGKGQAASLIKLLAGYRVTATRESGDKETRAVACAAQWQAGNIDVVRAGWNESFLVELDAFPKKGVHDDRVDGLVGSFNLCIQGSSFMANFVK